jgi:HEAT repeat protein
MPPATSGVDAAAEIAALGLGSRRWPAGTQAALALAATTDADVRIRIAALGALVRRARPAAAAAAWSRATADPDGRVRVRAAELAPMVAARSPADIVLAHLVDCFADPEPFVAEAAAWALGEVAGAHPRLDRADAIDRLAGAATDHADSLVREAAVAALGAIGDPAGLPAILAACRDKPAIRRRAVLALAPFEGPQVEAALVRATTDRDWQVRQAAEDLTSPG